MRLIELPELTTGVGFFDAALRRWKNAIERLGTWDVKPGDSFHWFSGETGQLLVVPRGGGGAIIDAVSTSAISAAPDDDTLGSGTAMLRKEDGLTLTDDVEVEIMSNFRKEVPMGTRLAVGLSKNGKVYKLIGADCPLTP